MDLGSEVEKKIKFDPKMERPQEYALHCDWVSFKTFFHNDPKALIQTFDLAGNTAIQVATRSDDPDLIRQLLDMLPDDNDRRQALRTGNAHKNTLLHQVIFCDNLEMVDTVLNYETDKKLKKIDDDEEDLLELLNDLSETPVYRAAKYGRLRMLKHMARLVDDIKKHFHRRQPKLDITSILHIAIIGQHFVLPDKGYDDDDEDDGSVRGKGDLETGKKNLKKHISSSPSVFSRIYYTLWKIAAKEWDTVKEIWERKKKHMLAALLADFLVSRDNSWMDTKHGEPRTEVVLPVIQPSNIAATKKAKLEKTHSLEGPIPCKEYTPLLLAASTGIVEIVRKIIDLHPDAISHVSQHDEQNVLHVAVKHRQKQIYKLLKKYGTLRRLGCQMANQGRTLLHQVARMDYYDGGNQPGVVFQLQDELRWFERVKRIVPCPHQLYCNDHNLTARELFDLEHLEMLKEAQEWIKGTAQSCSAVSVLVATVVFAAAYTVPGGTDDNGVPVLLDSPLFLFFTIMDVVGLASSLISVMMFLSILTSPFQMQEFYKSLPRKLTMGFTLLFISLTTTLLAFGSTILLTIRMENKRWSSSLIYSATFFPVTLFGLTQFPIIMAVKYRMKRLKKTIKKVIPNDVITTISTKPKKKRVYSKYV
ncbi:uncharacterized protein LOC129298317 isoform X2 [Prosopis cineraria]|uniref:uncharacterized protein LOC129298317 isoform X2 n=1 Tax=Prosopis cineraria TaxID=364024 RepID=UPI00241072C8|nr:uncharacterized protein LOC129298317 isoform X2 [Prosopis cineraria]